MHPEKKPIVIVGGGFGGLRVAQELSRRGRKLGRPIMLIDKHVHHVYTPLLYEVASGCVSEEGMERDLLRGATFRFNDVLQGSLGLRYVQGELAGVDTKGKTVTLADGALISYEKLVLALGSETDFFGIPGLEEKALTLKTREDALLVRRRIEDFLLRERTGQEIEMKIFIGGGGATGVELAAELAGCFRSRKLSRSDWSITLIEAGPRLLGMLPPALSNFARHRLESLGVKVHLDTCIKRLENEHLILSPRPLKDGEKTEALLCEFRAEAEKKFDADIVVWAGGVRGSATLANIGFPIDRKGRVATDGGMRVEGAANVFALGDCANPKNPVTSEQVPMLAQAALREADIVVSQILADAGHRVSRQSYDFYKFPVIIPLGGKSAIAVVGPFHFKGFAGWLLRQAADLRYFLAAFRLRHALHTFFHGARVYAKND